MTLYKALEELGFEEREIKLYIASLKYGELPVLQLAKRAEIDRSTAYDVLQKMIQKGFMASIIKNKTKHFQAISPSKLFTHFQEKLTLLKKVQPALEALSKAHEPSLKAEVYEGRSGIMTLLRDLIFSKKDYHVLGFTEECDYMLKHYSNQSIVAIEEHGMKEKLVTYHGHKVNKPKSGDHRYIPKKYASLLTTAIYDDTVFFAINREPYYGLRIKNKDFADGIKKYFDFAWDTAKKKHR